MLTQKKRKRIIIALLLLQKKRRRRRQKRTVTPHQQFQLRVLRSIHERFVKARVAAAFDRILHPGRGNAILGIRSRRPRRANTSHYQSDRDTPNRLHRNTGHTPNEFDVLLAELHSMPVGFNFRGPRNLDCTGDPGSDGNIALNAARKNQTHLRKLSAAEELYEALKFLRHTNSMGSRRHAEDCGLAKAALDDSMAWIYTLMNHPTKGPPSLRNAISMPSRAERNYERSQLKDVFSEHLLVHNCLVDGTKVPHQINPKSKGHEEHYQVGKGYGTTIQVWTNLIGRIIHMESFSGNNNDRGDYNNSKFFQEHRLFLDNDEGVCGDGAYQGIKSSNGGAGDCNFVAVPFNVRQLTAASPAERPMMLRYNSEQRRMRLVVENAIGAVKQWGRVRTPSRGDIYKQPHYFQLCAKLTVRLQTIRKRFPRSIVNMKAKVLEAWEEALGDNLYIDPEVKQMYYDKLWA